MTYVLSKVLPIQGKQKNSNQESGDTGDQDHQEHRSTLVSRNLTILGRRTSVRLEPEMWSALNDATRRENTTIHSICSL
ncbi:MAG: ribbon-helix-helix domain-containing protein, partial [Pseudomonadota bacterium]